MPTDIARPEFYQRIDRALMRRQNLASAIEALAAESYSNRMPSDVKALLVSLRGSAKAEDFVEEGSKAKWLPLVLRGVSDDGATSDNAEDLKQIESDMRNAMDTRTSQWRLFAYPLFILASSVLLFVILSLTVIPTFQKMFREFELTLPPATRWLMALSDMINLRPVLFCFSLVLLTIVAFATVKLFARVFQWLECSWFLGFFLSGSTSSIKAMGRFTSTLAELLNVGAPLDEAISIAGRASQNLRFRIASDRLAADIGSSERFCHRSATAQNFPALVSHALEAGPDGVPSITLLRQVSLHYGDRAKARFNGSTGLLGPLMLICVGFCVGFIVLSLFMPLTMLITSLSG